MAQRNGLLANYIPAPADPSRPSSAPPLGLLGYAENLSMGAGRGVRNQLAGLLSMAQNPRETVNALYQMGTTPSQWAPMVGNALRDTSRTAMSGPIGLGQVIGENVGFRGAPSKTKMPSTAMKEIKALPSHQYMTMPDTPPRSVMDKFATVQNVDLSKARRTQSKMGGVSPGPLVPGYADKPVAVRLENGEFLIFDGHHRTVAAINSGAKDMPMYVVDAKKYAPEVAGRKPVPPSMSDEELLKALGID